MYPEIINKSVYGGVAGKMGRNPKGVFIHNDAMPVWATAKHYTNSLRNHPAARGFAHYYIDKSTIFRAEDTFNRAWHCGEIDGNNNYLSYEVCQSMGASNQDFLLNELMVLRQVAEDMAYYGIPVNESTVKLHKEVYATACPHRSVELHGGTAKTKSYFIEKIKYFQGLGKTVKEMIDAEKGKVVTQAKDIVKKIEAVNATKPSVFGLKDGLYEFGSWKEANEYTGLPYITAGMLKKETTPNAILMTWDTFNGRSFRICVIYGKTKGWREVAYMS